MVEQQYSFAEICHRKRLRWDLRMPECSTAWAALRAQVEEQALPQLAALAPDGGAAPRILMSGAVVSRPGAGCQSFHIDGTGRLVNVFVPLVDVAPDCDGTQFWPGSHLDPAAPDAAPELEGDAAAMAAMVSPGCPAGGFLCFDYRCVHRGLGQELRERAVAYFVVALEPDVEDSHNFPQLSVHDAPAELTETMPFWDDAVGRVTTVLRTRRDASFRRLAQARQLDAPAAKQLVRGYCATCGLEWGSLQAQESAARALLLDPDYRAPSAVSQVDSEETRDCEPDVVEAQPIVTVASEDAAKAAWLAKQGTPPFPPPSTPPFPPSSPPSPQEAGWEPSSHRRAVSPPAVPPTG